MADDDWGDGDPGFFFDDDDYLYVEDEFAVAVSKAPLLPSRPAVILSALCTASRYTRLVFPALTKSLLPREPG